MRRAKRSRNFREFWTFSRNFWKQRFAKVCLANIFRLSKVYPLKTFWFFFFFFFWPLNLSTKILKVALFSADSSFFCVFPFILNIIPKNRSRNFCSIIWIQYWRFPRIHSCLVLNEERETITFEDWAESTIWKHELGQKEKESVMTKVCLP